MANRILIHRTGQAWVAENEGIVLYVSTHFSDVLQYAVCSASVRARHGLAASVIVETGNTYHPVWSSEPTDVVEERDVRTPNSGSSRGSSVKPAMLRS